MDIKVTVDGNKAVVVPVGKLTVSSAPELEDAIQNLGDQVTDLVIDLEGLDYISSAGLRVLVSTQKMMMHRSGEMTIQHPNDDVYDVFDMTGLTEVLTIER